MCNTMDARTEALYTSTRTEGEGSIENRQISTEGNFWAGPQKYAKRSYLLIPREKSTQG